MHVILGSQAKTKQGGGKKKEEKKLYIPNSNKQKIFIFLGDQTEKQIVN